MPASVTAKATLRNKKNKTRISRAACSTDPDAAKNLIQLFYEQVNNNPDKVAVVAEDGQITYEELNRKSEKLAKHLRTLGVKNENLIGVCASLSTNFIICFLGILKAGAAYFPLDPTHPPDRLQYMLLNGNPSLIFTETKYSHLFDADKHKIIKIDEQIDSIINAEKSNNSLASSNSTIKAEDLAYVIFTSGSTGKPKGIMVTHISLPNIALAHKQFYPPNMKMLVSGGVCFDASLLVIFHALTNGETLYLFNYSPKDNIDDLLKFIKTNHINFMICVPSQYAMLLQKNCTLPSLQCVSLTGENLPTSLCKLHAALVPNAILYNEYGPTECAIGATIAKIYDPERRIIRKVTAGKPLPNTQIYILNHDLQASPQGDKGEICIGGIGLARGYLNNKKLTSKKFIKTSLEENKSTRIYRTGDYGRFTSSGEIEYLGRVDQRAYVCGHWVDLGEVEYHLSRCPSIQESALLVQENSAGKKQLAVYITSSKQEPVKALLLRYLRKFLPKHMLPSYVVQIDKFPLSPNGKIDREALANLYV